MKRIEQNFTMTSMENESNIIEIKKAIPFYFTAIKISGDIIGTLSILCFDKNDEKFIIHCSYTIDDEFEINLIKHCKICNIYDNASPVQDIVYNNLIKSSKNYLTDLHFSISSTDNYFIGIKMDDDNGHIIADNIIRFKVDYKMLSVFGAVNEYILNCGLDDSLLYNLTKINFKKDNFIPHFIYMHDYFVRIYKMAPCNDKERKSSDVIIWLELCEFAKDLHFSIICRFLLDEPMKKKRFKRAKKQDIELEFSEKFKSKIYISNFMYDFELAENDYLVLNCCEKLPNGEKSNDEHLFFFDDKNQKLYFHIG